MAGHWDTAIRGSSALQAAIGRALMCEVASLAGDSVVMLLWDCAHFYDSLRLLKLFRFVCATGYSKRLLLLGLQAHTAPRLFRQGDHHSDWMCDMDSVLAGCGQAVTWARMALYSDLDNL